MDARSREKIAGDLRATAGQQGWPPWRLTQAVRQEAGTPTLLMAWRLACGQTQDEAAGRVSPLLARRIAACLAAVAAGSVVTLENGSPVE